MNPLQYTSNEMISSTELIRKSKKVFDKLNKKEIEKAIILRDGKPSFLLLEFDQYEKIMREYLELKEHAQNGTTKKPNSVPPVETQKTEPEKTQLKDEEISDDDLKTALDKIDSLNELTDDEKKRELKEFWD